MTTVTSGQSPSFLVVSSGQSLLVQSGGSVTSTSVLSGGFETVSSGGLDTDGTVYNGGTVFISLGGLVLGLSISGALVFLSNGGTAYNTIIGSDLDRNNGVFVDEGITTGTVVQRGGEDFLYGGNSTSLTVQSGGLVEAQDALVVNPTLSGGELALGLGATVSGVIAFGNDAGAVVEFSKAGGQGATIFGFTEGDTIEDFADQIVSATYNATGPDTGTLSLINSGGSIENTLTLEGDYTGEVFTTTILATGSLSETNITVAPPPIIISSGQSPNGLVVSSGQTLIVASGGSVVSTTVLSGGSEKILSGGNDTDGTVYNGGVLAISAGAVASGLNISGAFVYLDNGGTATNTIVGARPYGDNNVFYDDGTTTGTVVQSGGYELLIDGTSTSATIQSGGIVVVQEAVIINPALSGGTLELAANAVVSGVIALGSEPGAYIEFSDSGGQGATISGFASGDIIQDYADQIVSATYSLTGTDTGKLSLINSGGTVENTLTLDGDYTGDVFTTTILATGTDSETDITVGAAPCYCLGTHILTDEGERRIEQLAIGDMIVTVSGEHHPIKWIGHRGYPAATPQMQPIRFCAGSLGNGLPHRDLLVSPEHAMFLDGVLVSARCLTNGTTIVRDTECARVDYYHIELEAHNVVFAEGAASESFLDDNSRQLFNNEAEFAALYPNATTPPRSCAPRVESGPALAAIRRRLDGAGVQEVLIDTEGNYEITVQHGVSAVRLITDHKVVPGDARPLGAAVNKLAIDGKTVALDDPRLASGWHPCEGAWRWTDGAALVLVAGAKQLEVGVAAMPFAAAA